MNAKTQVRYIDADVLAEAKKRINHVIDIFDHIFVAFSGGKDSLVVLSLVEEVWRELGRKDKINVVFRDEELIPDDVIEFVQEKAKNPLYNFRYYAVPMASHKFILGRTLDYIQWDDSRKWIRPKPVNAITELPGAPKNKIFSQYDMDFYAVHQYIAEQIPDDHQKELARARVNTCIRLRNNKAGGSAANFYGYPALYVFKTIVAGQYKRVIQPCRNPSKTEIEYEALCAA